MSSWTMEIRVSSRFQSQIGDLNLDTSSTIDWSKMGVVFSYLLPTLWRKTTKIGQNLKNELLLKLEQWKIALLIWHLKTKITIRHILQIFYKEKVSFLITLDAQSEIQILNGLHIMDMSVNKSYLTTTLWKGKTIIKRI